MADRSRTSNTLNNDSTAAVAVNRGCSSNGLGEDGSGGAEIELCESSQGCGASGNFSGQGGAESMLALIKERGKRSEREGLWKGLDAVMWNVEYVRQG